MVHLEHVHGFREVAETMLAEIHEMHVRREAAAYQCRGLLRADHLTAMRDCHQPRGAVHRWAEIVPVAFGRRTRVHADPHPDHDLLRPRFRSQRLLGVRCGIQGIAGPAERHSEPVTACGEHISTVRLDRGPQQHVMTLQRRLHRLGDRLPQPRRALDVREEKGDSP